MLNNHDDVIYPQCTDHHFPGMNKLREVWTPPSDNPVCDTSFLISVL